MPLDNDLPLAGGHVVAFDEDVNMELISVDDLEFDGEGEDEGGGADDDDVDSELDVDFVDHDDEDMLLTDGDDDDDDFLAAPSVNLRHHLVCDRIVSCLASASSAVREVWLGPSFASVDIAADALRVLPRTVSILDLDLRSLPASDISHTIWPILVKQRAHLHKLTLRVPHPHLVSALSKTMVMAQSNDNIIGGINGHGNDSDVPAFHWKRLDLCGNRIGSDELNHLVDALQATRHCLTSINLSCNDISDARALARLLSSPSTLEHLDLSFNLISDDCVREICLALRDPRSRLRELHLFSCQRLTREGVQHLADCLEYYNATLWYANIFACGYYQPDGGDERPHRPQHEARAFNPCSDGDATAAGPSPLTHQLGMQVRHWLMINRSGRYILRKEDSPAALLAPLLAKINDRPDAIYYHLQQIPNCLYR